MSDLVKGLILVLLAVVIFVFGYYMGTLEDPPYDVETLFATGLQDGTMTIYRGDATPMDVTVSIGEQTDENMEATVDVAGSGTSYRLSVFQREIIVRDAAGNQLAAATWDDQSLGTTLFDAAGDTVLHNPLSGTLPLEAAHHQAIDADALAILSGEFITAVLEAADNWTLRNRHQVNPLILRTEINDLPAEAAQHIARTLTEGKLDDMELINYHHDVLNHTNQREFFEGHKTMIRELTEWLRAQQIDGTPLGLPFGNLPYWDPARPIAEPFGESGAVAYEIMEDYPMCAHFRKRVGVPEDYFLFGAPSPELEHPWPCDPAEAETWCDTRDICNGDPHRDAVNPIDACEVIPAGTCPFGLLPQFSRENVCDEYPNLFAFHSFVMDWHGDTHIRAGGAMGIHTLTPATPIFWAFHVRLDALYDDWNNCP